MVSLRIALRYLFSRKSHNAVNVISIVSMAGVAVATAAIVCVLSVFNGFTDVAISRISLIDPELKVSPAAGKLIADADSVASTVRGVDGVAAATPVVEEQALAMFAGRQMQVDIIGVPESYNTYMSLDSTIIDGTFSLSDPYTALPASVISVGTAMRLGAYPMAAVPLSLYVPRRLGRINPANPLSAFRTDSLAIAGVFEVNQSEHDAQKIYIPLATACRLLDMDSEATSVHVVLDHDASISAVQKALRRALGPGYSVSNRLEQERESLRMIAVEKWITFLMLAFILLIASFNVISTLSMLIIEKADNMATLRAIGAPPSIIRRIFLCEGWLITVIGGLAGTVLGLILCLLQQRYSLITLGGDASLLSITAYPVRVSLSDILLVALLVAAVGWLMSYLTSRFASR